MAKNTLTKTAKNLRQIIIGFVILLIVVFSGNFLFQFLTTQRTPFIPNESLWQTADESFGILPLQDIPSLEINPESTPSFVIEGNLPQGIDAPDTMLVYKMSPPAIALNTIDSAVSTARILGFVNGYQELPTEQNALRFQWENASGTRTLEYEIINSKKETWKMRTKYFFDATAQLPKLINQPPDFYAQRGIGVLSQIQLGLPTLTSGQQEATLAKLASVDGLFSEPVSASSANYVDVQMFHQLLGAEVSFNASLLVEEGEPEPQDLSAKIYKSDPRKGSVSMLVSDQVADVTKDVYYIDYTKFSYNQENVATYNIVSPEEAWERVRAGEGSLTLLQKQPIDRFGSNRVLNVSRFIAEGASTELAYYEPDEWEEFLMPIYVFKGRVDTNDGQTGRFVFYVDALERL